ncbi:nucleoside triphosphate pyrophosphohydrolase ham1 [Exophiala dermatitidis]|nr:nucleoside triphosphate pyrophosphohydrolase ham1 [Exophiala dermatitidis]KAJ4627759.1 nucleoside triphosphate pyrophosphohydrolase ham1 [Exophiala dermatitidis]
MASSQRPTTLNFITGNPNKLAEVRAILADVRVPSDNGDGTFVDLILDSKDVPGHEIQGTIEEVARDKCARAAAVVGGPVLTEDTALEFAAYNGLPGPYIKYFLQAVGHEGLNNMLAAYEDKTAFAVCTFAYCAGPGHEPILFQGRTQGKIVPARGPGLFGMSPHWASFHSFQPSPSLTSATPPHPSRDDSSLPAMIRFGFSVTTDWDRITT